MEEGQCWTWTNRKHSSLSSNTLASPTNNSTDGDSWEEQAFAEEGRIGGCIWPPRSYSCSFCSREFRSAQALGGHMNVHRRDRARLKQPPIPHKTDETALYHKNSFTSLAYSNTNPNSDHLDILASKAKLAPPSLIHENSPPYDSCISWSNFAEERLYSQKVDLIGAEDEKISMILDTDCKEEADIKGCKRRRITNASLIIPFFSKSISVDNGHRHIKSQMFESISPSSVEELDLELRLGPKV